MADAKQLKRLWRSTEVWNKWRDKNPSVAIDLSKANLYQFDLDEANLSEADLGYSFLREAHFRKANLREANLKQADLSEASLFEADLRQADLSLADLDSANLQQADLGGADLAFANLRKANVIETNFLKAKMSQTIFGGSDLSRAIGLEDVIHHAPSPISTDTFVHSKGKVSEAFLRGCGLPDWEIEGVKLHNPELNNEEVNKILYKIYDLRATQAIQVSPLFVSYSHDDSQFVDKIGNSLTKKGIRFWRDIHDMKAGRMEKQIDRAIRQNPTVLLVLSEHSLSSDWVEHEVRTARGLEKDMGRDVLCPIALDDSWKSSPWPARVMEQIMEYNILDFSAWEDDVKFENTFKKLIEGLDLFYKDKSHGE